MTSEILATTTFSDTIFTKSKLSKIGQWCVTLYVSTSKRLKLDQWDSGYDHFLRYNICKNKNWQNRTLTKVTVYVSASKEIKIDRKSLWRRSHSLFFCLCKSKLIYFAHSVAIQTSSLSRRHEIQFDVKITGFCLES